MKTIILENLHHSYSLHSWIEGEKTAKTTWSKSINLKVLIIHYRNIPAKMLNCYMWCKLLKKTWLLQTISKLWYLKNTLERVIPPCPVLDLQKPYCMIWTLMTKNGERIWRSQTGPSFKCLFLTKPYCTIQFMVKQKVGLTPLYLLKDKKGHKTIAQKQNTVIGPAVCFVRFAL